MEAFLALAALQLFPRLFSHIRRLLPDDVAQFQNQRNITPIFDGIRE
jgi:hypothetical protein